MMNSAITSGHRSRAIHLLNQSMTLYNSCLLEYSKFYQSPTSTALSSTKTKSFIKATKNYTRALKLWSSRKTDNHYKLPSFQEMPRSASITSNKICRRTIRPSTCLTVFRIVRAWETSVWLGTFIMEKHYSWICSLSKPISASQNGTSKRIING